MPAPRSLLVISAQPHETLAQQIAAGEQPRRDYFELQRALGADLLVPADVAADPQARLLSRAAGLRVGLAWLAFWRRGAYDAIYTDGEGVGLPLAALLKLTRARPSQPRHTMLTHYLSPAKKRAWFRLGVASHLDCLICHSSAQYELATKTLGVPAARVRLLPYFADERFWQLADDAASKGLTAAQPAEAGWEEREVTAIDDASPGSEAARAAFVAESLGAASAAGRSHLSPLPAGRGAGGEDPGAVGEDHPTICAVGLEFRDYGALVAAARGLEAEVAIAAASQWSHHSAFAGTPDLPTNVHVASYDYQQLRQLYARSRVVVVPLREVDNQAGITVILEAMAMGKPVVVTGTRGQTDVVRDRRYEGRGRMPRQWWPGFVDADDLAETIGRLPTGFYVTPGDADELRRAITYLLTHPEVASELGRNARRVVEACFTLDAFVERFAAVIRGDVTSTADASITSAAS